MSNSSRIVELALKRLCQAERTWDAYVNRKYDPVFAMRALPMTKAEIQMRREEALRIHFWAHPKMDCRNPELAAARNWTPYLKPSEAGNASPTAA